MYTNHFKVAFDVDFDSFERGDSCGSSSVCMFFQCSNVFAVIYVKLILLISFIIVKNNKINS